MATLRLTSPGQSTSRISCTSVLAVNAITFILRQGASFATRLFLVVACLYLGAISTGFAAPTGAELLKVFQSAEAPPPPEMLNLRDPFKSPALQLAEGVPRTELETIPIDQFKLLAVITGPERMRAMLASQGGKNFFVGVGTKIGVRRGSVRKITKNSIKIREKVVNILGQEEDLETEIKIAETKLKATASSLTAGREPVGGYR